MSIDEIFLHQNDFIMSGIFSGDWFNRLRPAKSMQYPGGGVISDADYELYRATIAEMSVPVATPKIDYMLMVSAVGVGFHGYKATRCPQLGDDNQCQIYSKRPVQCRSVPLTSLLPEKLQEHPLRDYMRHGCVTQDSPAPNTVVLYRDGAIVAPAFRRDLAAREQALREDRHVYGLVVRLMQQGFPLAPPIRQVLEVVEQGGQLETSMTPLLFAIGVQARVPKEQLLGYVSAQIGVIEQAITDAVQRRQASDKPHTKRMRAFLDEYRRFAADVASPRFDELISGYADLMSKRESEAA